MKKVLVMGGTGAMGVYLVPELLKKGYQVDVLSLDDVKSSDPNLRYIVGNGHDMAFMEELLKNGYDGIVDFMIYLTEPFRQRYEMLLKSTSHYIYLSSYRVYAGEYPIREDSPQLLDVSTNEQYLAEEDYSLYKARCEDILEQSAFDNWTAVRPAITYSQRRYQLVTLEAPVVIHRARTGRTILLPEGAKHVQGTMTWAGDVAKMFAALLFNPKAMREHYTLATAEHHSWETIASYYEELAGLKVKWIDDETYVRLVAGVPETQQRYWFMKWQLEYDRLFERIVDNSKILAISGLKQEELMPLKEGLKLELSNLPGDVEWNDVFGINERMDAYLAEEK